MSIIALALAAALSAQQDPDVCLEDCDLAAPTRLRRVFDTGSLEDDASAGASVFRAYILDDYGRDRVAVTFVRHGDQRPALIVRDADGREIRQTVSAGVWRRVASQVPSLQAFAPEQAASPPAAEPDESVDEYDPDQMICMHSWYVTVEAANAPGDARSSVRRRGTDTCSESEVSAYGFWLADLAVQQLPVCRELKEEWSSVDTLQWCLRLEGSTRVAATLLNAKASMPRYQTTREEWAEWLAAEDGARLDWSVAGLPDAGSDLAQAVYERNEQIDGVWISQTQIGANDTGRGWIDGKISHRISAKDEPDLWSVADYHQEWRRSADGPWRLRSWTVGPAATVTTLD